MFMVKYLYFSGLLFFFSCVQLQPLQAQSFNFSQYMNTSAALNPSLPALEQEMAVRLNFRRQSIGNWNATQSSVFSAYYPWLASKGRGPTATAGLMLLNDKVAPVNGLSFLSLGVPLSFAVSLNKWQRLSFGLMPVYNSHRMNHDGLSTISQYSKERGYNPLLPLNEPLLDARASYLSWNAGISWNRKNKRGELLSAGGISAFNLNQPHEQFLTYKSPVPMAFQAFFTSSLYHNRFIRLMPEVFYASYGPFHQWQTGVNLNYNLRYTSLRQGSLNLGSRYHWGKAVIVTTQLEQPTYAVGFSVDLYTNRHRPFTQAFEVSLALKQGVVGRFRRFKGWPFGRKTKNKKASRNRRSRQKVEIPFLSQQQRKGFIETTEESFPQIAVQAVEVKLPSIKGRIVFHTDESLIKFATASTKLQQSAVPAIASIADFLLNHPSYKVLIVGHTDDIGGHGFNKKLSMERAKSVAAVLLRKGVGPETIRTEGAGMERPLLPNTSNENRALNRRVEFLLYKE